jgi:hypothetical protein
LQSNTHFRQYRGRRDLFSCFVLPNSFPAVPWESGLVFIFYALGHIFGGTEGVGSRFHILPSRTRFRRYLGRQVPFSCFTLTGLFSAVLRVSGPVFMFCTPEVIFGGVVCVGSLFDVLRSENVRSIFHVFHAQTRFPLPNSFSAVPRCRVMFFLFCAPLPDSFLAVPRESGHIFMFCAPELIFSGIEGAGSHFNVLRCWTHFNRYGGPRVPYSCFSLPDSFSEVL